MAGNRPDPFRDHVHELLAPLGNVRVRAMFGGYGIYVDEVMFALIAEDALYLKVDQHNQARFEEAGLEPFVYASPKGPMPMRYRRAPDEGLDDADVLCEWARGSIDAAMRARDAKERKPASAAARANASRKPTKPKPRALRSR